MKSLTNGDIETYLQNGFLTKPFLDDYIVKQKVEIDYNAKILIYPNYTKIESLFCWINHCLQYSQDEEFIANNKFQRNAQEIWDSGYAVGCSDYAILFATFARQLGLPTTILATAEINFYKNLIKGNKTHHVGHYFCECFYENKWYLVDPANKKLENEFSVDVLQLSYNIHNGNKYIPYLRCLDLGKRQTIKEHNIEMDYILKSISDESIFEQN